MSATDEFNIAGGGGKSICEIKLCALNRFDFGSIKIMAITRSHGFQPSVNEKS